MVQHFGCEVDYGARDFSHRRPLYTKYETISGESVGKNLLDALCEAVSLLGRRAGSRGAPLGAIRMCLGADAADFDTALLACHEVGLIKIKEGLISLSG